MNETMNLNGMGIGGTAETVVNNSTTVEAPVEKNNIELQETTTSVPESSTVSGEENKSLNANNEMNFEDLDMIKELRADEEANRRKNDSIFSSMDFGPLKKYLEDDDVTDISYSNGGQLWLKTLSRGVYRVDSDDINDALIEKIAFQCSNVMGKTFNMAHPFLDSESAELRMNFIHDSIARNGIAVVFRKTPAKIRLEKEKLMKENYVSLSIHDFLIKAVQGHCNIIMCGETGSGKTEFLKYLASHTFENEKIVTVEDTLELHLDRIYPHRDIVAMKTNNIASYSDVLVTCMRQNPIWILLSEVRSAEAVTAVRNSISSGHFILSTIHADKAANIPYRLYSLLESNIDVEQFLNTIYRYVQLGVYLRGRFDPKQGRFVREIGEVTEFYVNDNNECISNTIYQKTIKGDVTYKPISEHLLNYLEGQGIDMTNIREANGDLEKAQSYTDELEIKETVEEKTTEIKEQPEIENIELEEKVETKVEEVKVEPISPVVENVSVTPVAPQPEEVNVEPVAPVVENISVTPVAPQPEEVKVEPVAPVVENISVTPVAPQPEEVKVEHITPVVENTIPTEVKPVPVVTAQVIEGLPSVTLDAPTTPVNTVEPLVSTPNLIEAVQPQTTPSEPVIDTSSFIAPQPVVQQPIDSGTDTTEGGSQVVPFTPVNVTNIQ